MNTNDMKAVKEIHAMFLLVGLPVGRDFGSRSKYRAEHIENQLIPCACVYTRDRGHVWCGDLDLATSDQAALKNLSRLLNRKLNVLREQVSRQARSYRWIVESAEVTVWRDRVQRYNPDQQRAERLWAILRVPPEV
jgi:hypothetical protein